MLQSIKKSALLMLLVTALVSCNQGLTLQTYYVDNEIKPGFTALDVPTSLLNIDQTILTEDEKKAYKSVDKLNMLAFVLSEDNVEEYKVELAKVKTILKDPKYDEFMRGGSAEGKFAVKFIGEPDDIDELVLFGSASDKGFAIVRVLGNDMNLNEIMKLGKVLENTNLEGDQMNQFMGFFK
ncbi:MAG: DUF4252 domain-containing protein [Bacteroidota bacterium]